MTARTRQPGNAMRRTACQEEAPSSAALFCCPTRGRRWQTIASPAPPPMTGAGTTRLFLSAAYREPGGTGSPGQAPAPASPVARERPGKRKFTPPCRELRELPTRGALLDRRSVVLSPSATPLPFPGHALDSPVMMWVARRGLGRYACRGRWPPAELAPNQSWECPSEPDRLSRPCRVA